MRRVTRSLARNAMKRKFTTTNITKNSTPATPIKQTKKFKKRKTSKKLPPLTPSDGSPPRKKPPVKDWKRTYAMVNELRSDRTAPVDVYGSEALAERPPAVTQEVFHYQTLIALMLSSQTKDPVVGAAMKRIREGCNGAAGPNNTGFSAQGMSTKSMEEIKEMIYGVGFHNNKAKYIYNTTEYIMNEKDGKVPNTFHGLCKLSGVGPKMAMIVMDVAFNQCLGVSIDTHLHRMLQQLKWVKNPKNPEDTRKQLESWLPRSYWKDMNYIWVGLGQEIREEKVKLIIKAKKSSDPPYALNLLKKFGIDVLKICKKEGIEL
jgi:endonuclease-3